MCTTEIVKSFEMKTSNKNQNKYENKFMKIKHRKLLKILKNDDDFMSFCTGVIVMYWFFYGCPYSDYYVHIMRVCLKKNHNF